MEDVAKSIISEKLSDPEFKNSVLRKIIQQLMIPKTEQCKHKGNCVSNAFKGLLKNVLLGYGIKLGSQILMMLVKRKLSLTKLIGGFKSADTLQFSMFLGMVCFLFKTTLCTMRRFNRSHDNYNALIAGIICSLAAFVDNSAGRRQTIILYLFSRSFESLLKLLDSKKIMAEPKDWNFYMLVIQTMMFSYTFYCEKDIVLPIVSKNLSRFECLKPNENIMFRIYEKVPL